MRNIIIKRKTVGGHGRACCDRDETVVIDVRGFPSGTQELSVELTVFDREKQRYLPGKAIYVTLAPEQAQQFAEWLTTREPMLRYDRSRSPSSANEEAAQ
jgi:hypothetical protein